MEGVHDEFVENIPTDMAYGAAGFGVGKVLNGVGNAFYTPSDYIGTPNVSRGYSGVTPLLNTNSIQKGVIGVAQAGAAAASDANLLQCITGTTCNK